MTDPENTQPELLSEGFKITDDAHAEIMRIASRDGRDPSDVEFDLVKFLEREFDRKARGARPVKIGAHHVIQYDVGSKVFSPQIFYYDDAEGFVRLDVPEDGAGLTKAGDEIKFDLDAGGNRDQEEEDREENEELEDDEEEIGSLKTDALRQRGRSLIYKRVKRSLKDDTGKEVDVIENIPFSPIARYYQLLPRDALISHVYDIYKRDVRGLVREVIARSGDPSAAQSALAGVRNRAAGIIKNYAVYLNTTTFLADWETDEIITGLINHLEAASTKAHGQAQSQGRQLPKREIDTLVEDVDTKMLGEPDKPGVIRIALRRRSESSKLLSYLEGDQVTRNQRIEIHSLGREFIDRDESGRQTRSRGITSSYIGRFSRKLESLMDFSNVNYDPSAIRAARDETREATAVAGESGVMQVSNADIETTKHGTVTSKSGFKQVVTQANQEDTALAALFSGRGDNRVPGVSLVGSSKMLGGLDYERVTVKVRSGETRETLYNSMQDRRDLRVRLRSNTRGQDKLNESPTAPSVIMREIRATIENFNAAVEGVDPAEVSADKTPTDALLRAEKAASTASKLSGLVEYMAMSGHDVLDEGSQQLADRKRLVAVSQKIQDVALALISKVARTHIQIEIGSHRESLLLAAKRNELRDADEEDQKRLERQIADLVAQVNQKSGVRARQDLWRDVSDARHQIESLDADSACYSYFTSYLTNPSAEDDVTSTASTVTLDLAGTRGMRTVLLGRQLRAAVSREANVVKREKSLDDLETAQNVYDERVSHSVFKLLSRNKVRYHLLRPTDTIDSICREYGIGEQTRAEDIALGKVLVMPLPRQLKMGDSPRRLLVVKIGEGRDPEVDLEIDKNRTITLRRSAVLSELATHEKGIDPDAARAEFSRVFINAAGQTFGNIPRNRVSPAEPLLDQLVQGAINDMMDDAKEMLNASLSDLAESASFKLGNDKAFSSFDPRSPDSRNSRLVHTLRVLCLLAKRSQGIAPDMDEAVAGAFPGMGSEAVRFASLAQRSPDNARSVLSDVDTLVKSVATSADRGEGLLDRLREIIALLGGIARDRRAYDSVVKRSQDGSLARDLKLQFSEMPIPVPATQSILTPGSVITIAEPNRTLSERSLDLIQGLGIHPSALISPAVNGFMSAIKSVTYDEVFEHIVQDISATIGAQMAEDFVREAGDDTVDKQRVKSLFSAQIELILSSNAPRSGFLTPTAPTQGFEEAADSIAKLYSSASAQVVRSDRVAILSDEDKIAITRAIEGANDDLRMLFKQCVDVVSRRLSSPESVQLISTIAPCLAAMLSRANASPFAALCLRVLEATAPDIEKRMTTAHRRSLMGSIEGERTSGSMSESILSSEADRIGAIVSIINADYKAMQSENARIADQGTMQGQGWSPNIAVVIARAQRLVRGSKRIPSSEPVPLAALAQFFNLGPTEFFNLGPTASQAQVEAAAQIVKTAITEEISNLSASAAGGNLHALLTRLIRERARSQRGAVGMIAALSTDRRITDSFSQKSSELATNIFTQMPQIRLTSVQKAIADRRLDPHEIIQHLIDRIADAGVESTSDSYRVSVERFASRYTR